MCPICEEQGVLNSKEEVCRNCGSLEGIVGEECVQEVERAMGNCLDITGLPVLARHGDQMVVLQHTQHHC